VAIHKVELTEQFPRQAKKVFGDAALFFAFRKDAAFLALGEDGLEAIKAALGAKAKPAPLFQSQSAVARLVPLITAVTKDGKGVKLVKDAIGSEDEDQSKVSFTVEGGKAFRARFTMNGAVIKLVARAAGEAARARARRDADEEKD